MNTPFDIRLRRFFNRYGRANLWALRVFALVLVILRAEHVIATPWWVVTLPFYGRQVLGLGTFAVGVAWAVLQSVL